MFAEVAELSRMAEDLGFDAVTFPEHHLHTDFRLLNRATEDSNTSSQAVFPSPGDESPGYLRTPQEWGLKPD